MIGNFFCGCGLAISDAEAKSTDGLASDPNQQLYHFSAYKYIHGNKRLKKILHESYYSSNEIMIEIVSNI